MNEYSVSKSKQTEYKPVHDLLTSNTMSQVGMLYTHWQQHCNHFLHTCIQHEMIGPSLIITTTGHMHATPFLSPSIAKLAIFSHITSLQFTKLVSCPVLKGGTNQVFRSHCLTLGRALRDLNNFPWFSFPKISPTLQFRALS